MTIDEIIEWIVSIAFLSATTGIHYAGNYLNAAIQGISNVTLIPFGVASANIAWKIKRHLTDKQIKQLRKEIFDLHIKGNSSPPTDISDILGIWDF